MIVLYMRDNVNMIYANRKRMLDLRKKNNVSAKQEKKEEILFTGM